MRDYALMLLPFLGLENIVVDGPYPILENKCLIGLRPGLNIGLYKKNNNSIVLSMNRKKHTTINFTSIFKIKCQIGP